jgi:hypothetical protein
MKLLNILAGAGVVAALALAFATGASSTPYHLGALTASAPLSQSVSAKGSVDDIFDFQINPPPLRTYGQLVDFLVAGQSGLFDVGATIGLYTSAGNLLGSLNSIATIPGFMVSTGATTTVPLMPGDYYVEVKGHVSNPAGANYTMGVFGAAVPEPATWVMLIGGLGLMGASLRLSRRSSKAMTLA